MNYQQQQKITYGSGVVYGLLTQERLCIAGSAESNIELELCQNRVEVIAAHEVHGLANLLADGIIGLAPSGALVFLDQWFEGYLIQERQFSVSVEWGVLTLGGYDINRFSRGPTLWLPVKEPDADKWIVGLHEVRIAGKTLDNLHRRALIDTGTSYLHLPPADYQ